MEYKNNQFMKFVVIGESCLDVFNYGICERLSPEAPVPVFKRTSEVRKWGMATNVYENLKSIVKILDPTINEYLINQVTSSSHPVKTRYVEEKSNHLLLRVDSWDEVPGLYFKTLTKAQKLRIFDSPYILVSDYNKGFLTHDFYSDLRSRAMPGAKIYVDTKKLLTEKMCESVDFIKLNLSEYNNQLQNAESVRCVERFDDKIIVTMGMNGARWNSWHLPVEQQVRTTDVSGAGDTFFAAFCAYSAIFGDTVDAIQFANKCAMNVCTQRGTSVPDMSWYKAKTQPE